MTMEIQAATESEAYATAETACKKLLANLIMESYNIRVRAAECTEDAIQKDAFLQS